MRDTAFLLLAATVALLAPSVLSAVHRGTYKLPAEIDPDVLPGIYTELWAEVLRPTEPGPFPLVLFLHGNHATCGAFKPNGIRVDQRNEYSRTGACDDGYVVVPNHEGYRYAARPLAARGFVVVSINSNRGINGNIGGSDDCGLILARGRLVLKHLALLASWNRGEGAIPDSMGPALLGQIDFTSIGFMGHSRGGEGVRAALDIYREPQSAWPPRIREPSLQIKAIFEIAPVDGQTTRTLDTRGVASVIILPSCDADVSTLEGHRVFDRIILGNVSAELDRHPKAVFTVVGANHNAFNTEWQTSESPGCRGTDQIFPFEGQSKEQMAVFRETALSFFKAFLFGRNRLAKMFDPSFPLKPSLSGITFYERSHIRAPPGPNNALRLIQRFTSPSLQSDDGLVNRFQNVTVRHRTGFLEEHASGQRTAQIKWVASGAYYQINLTNSPNSNFSAVNTLSFRIAITCAGQVCRRNIDQNPDVALDVALVLENGELTKRLDIADYVILRRPTSRILDRPHDTLRTVELPVKDFLTKRSTSVSGIRFTFNAPTKGLVHLADIIADTERAKFTGYLLRKRESIPPVTSVMRQSFRSVGVAPFYRNDNDIVMATKENNSVAVYFASTTPFPITDSLPQLRVGTKHKSEMGAIRETPLMMKFILTAPEFYSLIPGSLVVIKVGAGTWDFGGMPEPRSLLDLSFLNRNKIK